MRPPNIIVFFLDDLGWRDLSCYGSTFYETPRLDALARQGIRFTDAYASCPVCSPSRASLQTGKYPATVGITNWIPGNPWGKLMGVPYLKALPKSETTIAQALKQGGYQTWHVGKWHIGPKGHWPEDFGYDVNIAGHDRGAPHTYFSPYNMPNLPDGPEGEYLTDRLTDEAILQIERRRDAPFFLHLAHYAVHAPIEAPRELIDKYKRKAKAMGLDRIDPFVDGEDNPCIDLQRQGARIRRRIIQSDPAYAAMIENLDTNIGRILDALEAQGIADQTLVIFTSDNGGLATSEGSPTCNAPLSEGKGWMYEGGVREPLLMRWPGVITAGTTCSIPVTTPDLYPTILEAAGLPPRPQQHVDGCSLIPLVRGQGRFDRDAIFWHYPHYSNQGGTPACSIRQGDWKLIEFFEDGRLELYNLRDDLGEQRNLAAYAPHIAQRLHAVLCDWRRSVEAKIPQPNRDYQAMLAGTAAAPDNWGRFPKQTETAS